MTVRAKHAKNSTFALKMGAIGENIWDFATAQGLKPVATVDALKK